MRNIWMFIVLGLVSTPGFTQELEVNYAAPQVWRGSRSVAQKVAVIQIKALEAEVDILEAVAQTEILVRLYNPGAWSQEVVLLVPVPENAAIKSFEFMGKSLSPNVELLPASQAKEEYDSIVAKLRDPALLEFAGCSLIKSSLFPIEAGKEQAIRIRYEQLLTVSSGVMEYQFPRTQRLSEASIPFKLKARVRSSSPLCTIYSPTHPINTEARGRHEINIKMENKGKVEPGSFLMSILREKGDLSAALMAYPDPSQEGGYFLMFTGLPGGVNHLQDSGLKREVMLILDKSGSMKGKKIQQAKAALLQVIQSLGDGEAFNIITYSNIIERFSQSSVIKSTETEAEARAYIKALQADGGTNLHDAVVEAMSCQPKENMLPVAILLSDGLPTVGETSEFKIRDACQSANKHNRRIFTFGVGLDVNVPLLDKLAQSSRASLCCVSPSEDVESKVCLLFDKLKGPIFTSPDIKILDEDGQVNTRLVFDVLPQELPDMYKGDRLVVMGRYKNAESLTFRLGGDYLGEPRAFDFKFSLDRATTRNSFVPRLWGSRMIALLVDELRQKGLAGADVDSNNKELVDEIVRLSLKFGVLTEYTSFLALEGSDLSDNDTLSAEANSNINRLAVNKRSGMHAVTQQGNLGYQRAQNFMNLGNAFNDRNMNRVDVTTVQQAADLAFFRRKNQWVDSRVLKREKTITPHEVVRFGSERFKEIFRKLVLANRQVAASLGSDTIFELDGKVIQVKYEDKSIASGQGRDRPVENDNIRPSSDKHIPGFEFLKEETFSCGGQTNTVKIYRHDRTGLNFVYLPGDNKIKSFLICQTEVTQAAWKRIMGTSPWSGDMFVEEGENYPATDVSWYNCVSFCKKATLRLPSETEWEYACRAGTLTEFCFGDFESNLGEYGWFDKNADCFGEEYPHRVGQKKPNAFGLYDVHGNLWEWCQDLYESGSLNMALRGGCWYGSAQDCRSADRSSNNPVYRSDNLGFRPACSLPNLENKKSIKKQKAGVKAP